MTNHLFYAQAFLNSLSLTVAGLCLTVWGVQGVSPHMEWPTNHLDCKDICCTKYVYICSMHKLSSAHFLSLWQVSVSLFGGCGGCPPAWKWPTNHLDFKNICCTKYVNICSMHKLSSTHFLSPRQFSVSLFGGCGGCPPAWNDQPPYLLTDWPTKY